MDCLSAEERRRRRSEFGERGATHLAFGDAPALSVSDRVAYVRLLWYVRRPLDVHTFERWKSLTAIKKFEIFECLKLKSRQCSVQRASKNASALRHLVQTGHCHALTHPTGRPIALGSLHRRNAAAVTSRRPHRSALRFRRLSLSQHTHTHTHTPQPPPHLHPQAFQTALVRTLRLTAGLPSHGVHEIAKLNLKTRLQNVADAHHRIKGASPSLLAKEHLLM